MLMHSLDTVKTRQQGDPHIPPRYTSLGSSYYTIFRQEGIRRGLYGGWLPALLGSFPGTVLFFGTYEYSKRHMLDYGVQSNLAYLLSGKSKGEKLVDRRSAPTDMSCGQGSSATLLRLLSTCPRKFSRPAFNFKAAITTPTLPLDTTTRA